ncbi:MAG TPA: hypothetical protein VGD58_28350 [Herpetosiphonaceae bacterium]
MLTRLTYMRTLGTLDVKSVQRDGLLRGMLVLPLAIAVAARLVLPLVVRRVGASLGVDLVAYYPWIMSSALLLITPVIYGGVIGFLLLDQRESGTLLALQVTPRSLSRYLFARLAAPMLISLVLTPVAIAIAGLVQVPFLVLMLPVLAAVPLAPLAALMLVAFAENKVQGLALVKGTSLAMIAALGAAWVPVPWQWAFGLLPTYWPVQLYGALLAAHPAWWYLLGGLLLDSVLLALLFRHFEQVVHR